MLRRPLVSAALSLAMIAMIMLVSQLKYDIVWMTANFLDVWIINADSIHYLLSIKPDLYRDVLIAGAVFLLVIGLFWWIDHLPRPAQRGARRIGRVFRRRQQCFARIPDAGVGGIRRHLPCLEVRPSGIVAVSEVMQHGYFDSGPSLIERLKTVPTATCTPAGKPPHIILIHDELSFDIRVAPGVQASRRTMASISSRSTASRATSSPRAPAVRAGSPNTTCCPGCRRARSGALPIT